MRVYSLLTACVLALTLISCAGSANRPSYVMAGGVAPADFLTGKRYQLGSVELSLRYVDLSANAQFTDEPSLNRQFAAFVAREMQTQGVASNKAADLRLAIMLDYGRRDEAPPIALYRAEVYDGQKLVAEHLTSTVEQAEIVLEPVEPNTLAERQQLAGIARAIVAQLRRVSQ